MRTILINISITVISLLLVCVHISCQREIDKKDVMISIASGKISELQTFLASGNSANEVLEDGSTLLIESIRYQNLDAFELLLNNGALVTIPDKYNHMPAYYASSSNALNYLTILYSSGIVLDDYVDGDHALIHIAARNDDIKLVQWLLINNASINRTDSKGMTALHYAARYNQVDIVKLLINNNVNINIHDSYRKTPLTHARDKNNLLIVDILLSAGAN
jgi:ankyrin repeat protein